MILDSVLGLVNDVAIDLGTANTLIYVKGRGVVLNEPSVIAVQKGSGQVVAVGTKAKEMLGRTPDGIKAVRPMKDGVIADFEGTEELLREFILQVQRRRLLVRPRMVICVPSGITEVERRAVQDSAEHAGAREVFLVAEPIAAAIGVGLPVEKPSGNMVVDIGGGTTEIAVIALSGIVNHTSVRVGGDEMDEAIMNHLRRSYNLLIGEQTAEQIKIQIGSAYPLEEEMETSVKGRDLVGGVPRTLKITSEEIREALQEPVAAIVETVTRTLERAEPELAADLIDNGICLVGGGSLLRGIDVVFSNATGLDVRIADDPTTCVARGTAIYLENLEEWKATMESDVDDF